MLYLLSYAGGNGDQGPDHMMPGHLQKWHPIFGS